KEAKTRQLYLSASAFAIDRTEPAPELALYSDSRDTDDPVQFLVSHRKLLKAAPIDRWRSATARLQRGCHLAASLQYQAGFDSLLRQERLPAQRVEYLL